MNNPYVTFGPQRCAKCGKTHYVGECPPPTPPTPMGRVTIKRAEPRKLLEVIDIPKGPVMTDELKPCPMCGDESPTLYGDNAKPDDGYRLVRCTGLRCGIETGWHSTASEAVTAWNTRSEATRAPVGETGKVRPGDIDWLRRAKDAGHCGEGSMESKARHDHNERIDRLLSALAAAPSPPVADKPGAGEDVPGAGAGCPACGGFGAVQLGSPEAWTWEPCDKCGTQAKPGARDLERALNTAWNRLCEVDDRNSPEEYPNMLLITKEELQQAMEEAAALAPPTGDGKPDREEIYRWIEATWSRSGPREVAKQVADHVLALPAGGEKSEGEEQHV